MISRKRLIILPILIVIVASALLFTSFAGENQSIGYLILVFIEAILMFLNIRSYRCPHCHRYGLRFHLSDEDAGNCKYCGKLVEWKESQN